jgi:hypothetical protein
MNIEFLTCSNCHKKGTKVESRKIEGMNGLGYSTYIHGNVAMKLPVELSQTNKNVFLFSKNGEQEGKTGPVWGVGSSGRGGYKERT